MMDILFPVFLKHLVESRAEEEWDEYFLHEPK